MFIYLEFFLQFRALGKRTSLALQAYVGAVDNSVTLPCAVRVICPTTNRRESSSFGKIIKSSAAVSFSNSLNACMTSYQPLDYLCLPNMRLCPIVFNASQKYRDFTVGDFIQ